MTPGLREAAQSMLDVFGGNVPDWLQEEAVALATALEASVRLPAIVVNVSGGVVQGASATHPMRLILIDHESDAVAGAEPADLIDLPGEDAPATVSTRCEMVVAVDPAWVRDVRAAPTHAEIADDEKGDQD